MPGEVVTLRYGERVLLPVWGVMLLVSLMLYLISRGIFEDVRPLYLYGMWFGLLMMTPYAIYYALVEIQVDETQITKRLRLIQWSCEIAWSDRPRIIEGLMTGGRMPNDVYQVCFKSGVCTIKVDSTMVGYERALDLLERKEILSA